MATDDERREVAARLRSLEVPSRVERKERTEKTAAWYELICSAVGGKKDPWFGVKALADRLADLIEPGDHIGDSDKMVDRDALLALADELEEDACWEVQSPGVDNRAWMLKDVCDRIREALGEGKS